MSNMFEVIEENGKRRYKPLGSGGGGSSVTKVSELENDAEYQTKQEVDERFDELNAFDVEFYGYRFEMESSNVHNALGELKEGIDKNTDKINHLGVSKVTTDTDLTIHGTSESNVLVDKIYGKSVQNGTPSPTNPIEIKSVGDSVNLIPFPYADGMSKTVNGITFIANSDGSINVNGTATATTFYNINAKGDLTHILKDGKKYRLTAMDKSYGGDIYVRNGSFSGYVIDQGAGAEFVVTNERLLADDTYNIVIRVENGKTINNVIIKPMLVEVQADGSYIDTYRPYGNALVFENKGKNLIPFPYTNLSTKIRGITWSMEEDGAIIGNGTGTEANLQPYCEINGSVTKNDKSILLKADTWYTISTIRQSEYAIGTNVYFLNIDTLQQIYIDAIRLNNGVEIKYNTNSIYQYSAGVMYDVVPFKVSQDVYGQVQVRYKAGTNVVVNNDRQYPILVEGRYDSIEELGDYEVYQHQQLICPIEPLRSIGDVKDELCKVDDGYEVVRRLGYEKYTMVDNYASDGAVVFKLVGSSPLITERSNLLCNISISGMGTVDSCRFNSKGNQFLLYSSLYTTKSEWQTFVDNNPIYVEYILATPIIEKLTNEQAEILLSLKSYNDTTYINQSMNVKGEIELEYATDRASALALDSNVRTEVLENSVVYKNDLYADGGIHNLLNHNVTSTTSHGMTITVNEDKSIKVVGTPDQNYDLWLVGSSATIPKGKYIVSGLPNVGSPSTTYFNIKLNGWSTSKDLLDLENVIEVAEDTNYAWFILKFTSGVTYNHLFKPMIRRADDTDPTYRPYAKSNLELTNETRPTVGTFPLLTGNLVTVWIHSYCANNYLCQLVMSFRMKAVAKSSDLEIGNAPFKPAIQTQQKSFTGNGSLFYLNIDTTGRMYIHADTDIAENDTAVINVLYLIG